MSGAAKTALLCLFVAAVSVAISVAIGLSAPLGALLGFLCNFIAVSVGALLWL